MKTRWNTIFATCLICAALVPPSQAEKLFAAIFDTGTEIRKVENSSFPKLIDNLIKAQDQFEELNMLDQYSASVTYFGIKNALIVDVDKTAPGGLTTVRLTSGLTDLDVSFTTAADLDELREQLVKLLYLEGDGEVAELLSTIVQQSAAAITDGGPGATTAQMADTTYFMFGLYQPTSRDQRMRGFESGAHVGFWITADSFQTEGLQGETYEGSRTRVSVPLWLHFNKRLSYVGNTRFDLIEIEGTQFYGLGADLGLAIRAVLREEEDRFGWEITPYLGGYGVGSADGVTAAVVGQFGLINRLEWRFFERGLLSFANQLTDYSNISISAGDYELSSPIDQTIMKNGLMYDAPIFGLKSWYANGFVVDTRFLEDAAVDNYQTLGAGLSYRLQHFSLNGSLGYDYAGDYNNWRLNLGFLWDL